METEYLPSDGAALMNARQAAIFINLGSEGAPGLGPRIAAMMRRYGYPSPIVIESTSNEMPDHLESLASAQADMLISYGGDGTSSAVASIAATKDVPFIALPGGTMNVLMQGLYASDDWEVCLLRALACATPRALPCGVVEDREGHKGVFYVGAIFGTPTRMSSAREELRDGRPVKAVRGALTAMLETARSGPVSLHCGGEKIGEGDLLNCVCPFMAPTSDHPDRFEIALFDSVTGSQFVTLGISALMGRLHDHERVQFRKEPTFDLTADHPIEVLLDGEPQQFGHRVTVSLNPAALSVLAPKPFKLR